MNSSKKLCAYLLTVVASVGTNFSLNSMAMDDAEFRSNFSRFLDMCTEQLNFLKEMENRSLHYVILHYILLDAGENNGEKLYILPMAEDQSKCMVVNEELKKCVYFSDQRKVAILEDIPNGYGNEIDHCKKKLFRGRYCTKETDIWTANVFDYYELNNPSRLFDDATPDMINLAKQKGIAGYKQEFCQIF